MPAMDGTDFRLAAALARTDAVTPPFRDALSFYAGRGYRPIYGFLDGHATAATQALLAVNCGTRRTRRIRADDYAPDTLCIRIAVASAPMAGCELRFSNALLRYAHDVRFGVRCRRGEPRLASRGRRMATSC